VPSQVDVAVATPRHGITFLIAAALLAAGAAACSMPRGRPLAPLLVLAGAAVTVGASLTEFLDYRAALAQTASTPPEVVNAVTLDAGGRLVLVACAAALATALLACCTTLLTSAPAAAAPVPADAADAGEPSAPDQPDLAGAAPARPRPRAGGAAPRPADVVPGRLPAAAAGPSDAATD
jgi:hypothetical protein